MKRVVVLGGNGFLGTHLCARLKAEGAHVTSIGRNPPAYGGGFADEYRERDLTEPFTLVGQVDEVYQLAGEVGGLGYIQNQANDYAIMHRSMCINLNVMHACQKANVPRLFFASSACVYPDLYYRPTNAEYELLDIKFLKPNDGATPEWQAYPAQPTNAFGWEKLFAERMYEAFGRQSTTAVRIGRLGNTYGPYCTLDGERAKVIAALCRKVAETPYAGTFSIWGDGEQTRSFTYVDDAVEGIRRLMASDYPGPVNIASTETVTINQLCDEICKVAGKILAWNHIDGPVGVRGRTSDNTLIRRILDWEPQISLEEGLKKTYPWIASQVKLQLDSAV